jgi:type II secretory pathway pseudopilin PulG
MKWQALRNRIRECAEDEAGESLAELLVTIAIMAIAVVVVVSSLAVGILLSARHRQQATSSTVLLSAAESVKKQSYPPTCPASYDPALGVSVPPGYSFSTPTVVYLDVNGAPGACSSSKLQIVTLKLTAPSGFTTSIDVVKRNGA